MSLTTLSCFVGLGLCGVGCAASHPLPAGASHSARPQAVADVAVATSARSVVADPGVVLESSSATPAELVPLLADVCQIVPQAGAAGGVKAASGCACCAPFDACGPGTAAEPTDWVYAPKLAVTGAFTRAGAAQLALPMEGCEPHAENYGGMVVLERHGQRYELARYVSGLNAQQCWPVRRDDGRDLLLCRTADSHQGSANEALWQWDLAADDATLMESSPLVSVEDLEWAGCWEQPGFEVSSARLKPLRLTERAGRLELDVEIELRTGVVDPEYLSRCAERERAPEGGARDPALDPRALLAARTDYVVFRFDGSKFIQR